MKLSYITVMVRDIGKSIAFYEKLAGLRVLKRFDPGRGEIAFLANGEGETMLELIQFDGVEKVSAKGMVVSFAADEALPALRERAVELGYCPGEIIAQGPKPAHFTLSDPDGITVEISA